MAGKTVHGVLSAEEGDRSYVSGNNSSASTILAGSVVCWDLGTDDDVKGFVLPAVGNLEMVAGILTKDVIAGAWTGEILRKGNYDLTYVEGTADIVKGDKLKVVAAQRYLVTSAVEAAGPTPAFAVAREAFTDNAEGQKKVFIRLP